MKSLFYNLFSLSKKPFIIIACLIINFLIIENYAQEKRIEYKNDRQRQGVKRGDIDNSKTLEDFFKDDGSPGLDTKKLKEYLNSNPDGLEEIKASIQKGITSSRTESTTGNGYLLSEDLNQWWGGGYSGWLSNHRWLYTYDVNNNLTEILQQHNWGYWYNLYRVTCTYDANNNRIDSVFQVLDQDQQVWETWWQWINTYDTNNKRIEQICQSWQGSFGNLVNSEKHLYIYDTNNNLSEDQMYWWNGGWAYGYTTYYTYDSNYNLIEKLVPSDKKWSYTYDGSNNLIEELYQKYDYSDSIWVNFERWTYTSDANNNRTQILHQNWDDPNWVDAYKTSYTYDHDNRLITELGQTVDYTSSTWTQQTSGTTNSLSAISFIDANTGWVVGGSGNILKTTNGGTNWVLQSGGPYTLNGVSFTDANKGWVVGYGGMLLSTTDGGTTWISDSSGITSTLYDIYFTDSINGITVGDNGTILRTTNGGTIWTEQTSGTTYRLTSICFIDASNGWVAGIGVVLKTTNGGENWILQNAPGFGYDDVYFTDANNGIAVGQWPGIISKTTNGGADWTWQLIGIGEVGLNGVYFTNANNGTIVGSDATIFRTTDGGSSWASDSSGIRPEVWLNDVFFTDANNGWAVGDQGTILRTINSATESVWINDYRNSYSYDVNNNVVTKVHEWLDASIYPGSIDRDVYSYIPIQRGENEITGIVKDNLSAPLENVIVTLTGDYNTSKIDTTDVSGYYNFNNVLSGNYSIKTSFPGYSDVNKNVTITGGEIGWTSQTSGTISDLLSVYFTNANTGWAVGQSGKILKTTNSGTTWSTQSSGTTELLRNVFFVDENNGWVTCGDNGKILRTTNGGINWTTQSNITSGYIYDIYFTDVNNGWITCGNGNIFKTTNGGTNWNSQFSSATALRNIRFLDENNGIVTGTVGLILKTTNGGTNWSPQTSGTTNELRRISFVDLNNGTIIGMSGTILNTTDGGLTWTSLISGTSNNLYGVFFTDLNNGWVVGQGGIILRTSNGGTSWVIETSGTNVLLSCLQFTSTNTGIIVGSTGTILQSILNNVYTVNFTLSPILEGSIPITDSLKIYADNIIANGSTFLCSGNVNINGILYFDSTVTVDKSGSLYYPEVTGNGKLIAKNIDGSDYEIAEGSFGYYAKENQLKLLSFEYLLNGTESLLGFQTKVSTLEIEENSTDSKITAYFIPWALPYPLQDVIDVYIEDLEETLIRGLSYSEKTEIEAGRTYSRVNGKDWLLNISLTGLKRRVNFGAFAIDEFSFYRKADSVQTIGGSISICIPGPTKIPGKNINLEESLENFK